MQLHPKLKTLCRAVRLHQGNGNKGKGNGILEKGKQVLIPKDLAMRFLLRTHWFKGGKVGKVVYKRSL